MAVAAGNPVLGAMLLMILAGRGYLGLSRGAKFQTLIQVKTKAKEPVMKAGLLLVLFVLLPFGAAHAQDRFQVFGGYSLTRLFCLSALQWSYNPI